MDKDSIIDMAAALIRDDIRSKAHISSEYPQMEKLQDSEKIVSESLKRLLSGIIKTGDADWLIVSTAMDTAEA